jgi:fructose-1,6-bisphosphatase/inositol monophosphatase family enzyme
MENYISIIFPFLKKAGKLALKNQNLITGCNKYDGSVVTETDLAISKMFRQIIDTNFKNHFVLDEETALKTENLKEKTYNSEYLWVIDPIDGTKTYFHGSNLFAISISLYKNLKPLFATIYLPSNDEIIYNDEKSAFLISKAFRKCEMKIELHCGNDELNKNSLVHFPVKDAKDYIKNYKFSFIDSYSAYIYATDVFKNIAQGAFLKDNISMWDVYGSLPIAEKLKIGIYNINDSSELNKIDFNLFKDDLKAKNIWLICHRNYKDEMLSIVHV